MPRPFARPTRRTALRISLGGAGWIALAGCAARSSDPAHPSTSRSSTSTEDASVAVQVTGSAPADRRSAYHQQAVVALAQVRRVWGPISTRPIRLVAPATAEEFTQLSGSSSDQVPALTTARGVVVVHPDLWSRTTAEGRQVVLTHELTHVALGDGGRIIGPRWVSEGAAEVTAYLPTGLAWSRIAPQLAARVRAGQPPAGPPTDTQLDPGATSDLAEGYALAWSWCTFLIQRRGMATFTSFVRAAAADGDGSAAYRSTYGGTPAVLADAYRRWLLSWP